MNFCFLLVLLSVSTTAVVGGSNVRREDFGATPEIEVHSGGVLEPLSHLHPYNSLVPQYFEASIPKLYLKVKTVNCTSSEQYCEFLENIKALANDYNHKVYRDSLYYLSYYNTTYTYQRLRAERGLLNVVGELSRVLFGTATEEQMSGIAADHQDIEQLRSMLTADHQQLVGFSRDAATYSDAMHELLSNLRKNVTEKFAEMANATNARDTAVDAVLQTISQLVIMNDLKQSYETAGVLCSGNKWPSPVVPVYALKLELDTLSRKLANHGYRLALKLHRIISLPLTKCSFNQAKMTIRLNVPIVRRGELPRISRILTFPFSHDRRTCRIRFPSTLAVTADDKTWVLSPQDADACTQISGICLIPPTGHLSVIDSPCISSFLNGGNPRNLLKDCVLDCEYSEQPTVLRLNSSSFVIANANSVEVLGPQHRCHGRYVSTTGSLLLHIGCECRIRLNNDLSIFPGFPCGNDSFNMLPSVKHLIPMVLTTLNMTIPASLPVTFANFSSVFNQHWTDDVPSLRQQKLAELTLSVWKQNVGSTLGSNYYLVQLWLCGLSLVVLFIVCGQARNFGKVFSSPTAIMYFLFVQLPMTLATDGDSSRFETFTKIVELLGILITDFVVVLLILVVVVLNLFVSLGTRRLIRAAV